MTIYGWILGSLFSVVRVVYIIEVNQAIYHWHLNGGLDK
jgi:hypothetical protein